VPDLFLYDDERARRFEPFSLMRPVAELRAGALLVRERWERALACAAAGFVSAPHLADFEEEGAARSVDVIPAGSIVANARFAPDINGVSRDASSFTARGRLTAIRLTAPLEASELRAGHVTLEELPRVPGEAVEQKGWWLDDVWHFVRDLGAMLQSDIATLGAPMRRVGADEAAIIGTHPVYAEDATIERHVVFDVVKGPVMLRRGSTVQAFTRVVGPCYVGEESLVTSDRVSGCSVGPHCKVHGEISTTVLLGYANKGHDGFVGHSYLGRWVNLGAGTTTSNLKNTYGTVSMWTPDGVRDTGMQFLGTMFGDHAKTGINLPLSTGSVIGAGASVVGRMPPKVVPPFAWTEQDGVATFRLEKFIEVAERVMARRNVTLGSRGRRQLAASHAARWGA
jgi:UDP-N-acetylglucosamine diphosphorylase/glucosamine-1-phosphate N-acetyltransferase